MNPLDAICFQKLSTSSRSRRLVVLNNRTEPMMTDRHRCIPTRCMECGETFLCRLISLKSGEGTTCSRKCAGHRAARAANALRPTSPERIALQVRVAGLINMRIRRGLLRRPDRCSECGQEARVDGHHEDYDKPYEVEWLCRSCHMKRHFSQNGHGDHTLLKYPPAIALTTPKGEQPNHD